MKEITCVDKDGNTSKFNYKTEVDKLRGEWIFRIYNIPPLESGESFQITVKEVDDDTVRIVMMNNFNVPEYKGTGIPDFMIPEIAKNLGKKVISSSNKNSEHGEYRNTNGDKVWERLKDIELAEYDLDEDRYRLV